MAPAALGLSWAGCSSRTGTSSVADAAAGSADAETEDAGVQKCTFPQGSTCIHSLDGTGRYQGNSCRVISSACAATCSTKGAAGDEPCAKEACAPPSDAGIEAAVVPNGCKPYDYLPGASVGDIFCPGI